jgi:hypothetical protein
MVQSQLGHIQCLADCVNAWLQEHAANPAEGWRAKDCAVYLVMAVTVKGRTGEKGATSTNRLVNVSDFFTQQVRLRAAALFFAGAGGSAVAPMARLAGELRLFAYTVWLCCC